MVVGGGIAGLTAAWKFAGQNLKVELVEKTNFLGGHSINYTCKATDVCRQCGTCSVEQMLSRVVDEPLINVHLNSKVKKISRGKKNSAVLEKNDIDKPGATDTLEFDAVVLATGFESFDPKRKSTFGYGRTKNLITGLELEHILQENSYPKRPSDGKEPGKIAFIQCVGSRDERLGNLWCSEVCCPYAMRMASQIKYRNRDADISIFYIDIQNTGKEFPIFYEKVKSDINFKRAIPVDIYQIDDDRLSLRYMSEETGSPLDEEFDLVVLSAGIMPGADTKEIAEKFDVDINEFGFLGESEKGVFTAGTAKGPGNIFDTIADSEKAAYETMKYLGVIK